MTAEGLIRDKSANKDILENDPMEAIFALNLGDFLTEHLISKDLLSKINVSVNDKITRLKNQLKELISIYSIDNTLNLLGFNSDDDFVIYNSIAKTIAQMLDIDSCHIFLNTDYVKTRDNKADFGLVLAGSSCFTQGKKEIGYALKDFKNPPVKAYLTGKSIYLKNVKRSKNWQPLETLNEKDIQTFLAVPMANNWENIGVICIENQKIKDITDEHISLIEITASLFVTSMRLQRQIEEAELLINSEDAIPMELQHLRTELTASIGDLGDQQQLFVEALAAAVDAKCQFSAEHSQKVALLARELSEYIKLNEKTVDLIYYAGLLRNIGKITLPDELLSKKGKLSKDDWNKLQNHPNVGVSMLMKINFLSEVVPYVHYHRERWNGKGEPEGLSGLSIPLGSRIIAVADAYQAMISERPYRKSLDINEVLDTIKQEAGTKWDPIIVDALIAIKEQ